MTALPPPAPFEPEAPESVPPVAGPRPDDVPAASPAAPRPAAESSATHPPQRPRTQTRLRTAPRRTVAVAVVSALALIGAVLLASAGYQAILDSRGRGTEVQIGPVAALLPVTPAALVVLDDGSGRAAGYLVLTIAAGGSGGSIVQVPGRLLTPLPGREGDQPLERAYIDDGIDGARAALESFLSVSFTGALAVQPDELEAALLPYAPFEVDLPARLQVEGGDDGARTVFESGPQSLDAADAVAFLTIDALDEDEIGRTARLRAFWMQVARAFTAGEAPAPSATTQPSTSTTAPSAPQSVAGWFGVLAAGDVAAEVLPLADPPADADVPEGTFATDPAYVAVLMARLVPGLVSPADAGARVWLMTPYADEGLTLRAAGKLASVDANLVMVSGSPDPDPEHTVIEYVRDADRDGAILLAELLGGAVVKRGSQPVEGIDLAVTLGPEFRDVSAAEDAAAASSVPSSPEPSTATSTSR
jgi:hypothetical protein